MTAADSTAHNDKRKCVTSPAMVYSKDHDLVNRCNGAARQ